VGRGFRERGMDQGTTPQRSSPCNSTKRRSPAIAQTGLPTKRDRAVGRGLDARSSAALLEQSSVIKSSIASRSTRPMPAPTCRSAANTSAISALADRAACARSSRCVRAFTTPARSTRAVSRRMAALRRILACPTTRSPLSARRASRHESNLGRGRACHSLPTTNTTRLSLR